MIGRLVGCWVLVLVAAAGCGGGTSGQDRLAQANSSNLQRLTNLYLAYQTDHNWAGPADEGAFKEFIRSVPAEKLERIGIDPAAVDELFVSERDGAPFQVRYGVQGNVMGSYEPVVFEATGQSGKRLVGFLDMTSREVEAAEYDDLFSGKAKAAGPTRQ